MQIVKKYESGIISDPITIEPEATIRDVIDLTRAEQIRHFRLLPYELGSDSDELTALLQIRRDVIAEKFSYLIDEMYT